MLQVDFIWRSQAALILFGHIASVYLAHLTALRISKSGNAATMSQIPMLMLMVLFTARTLRIARLPLAAGG